MKKMKREIKVSAGATKIENACQAKDKDMATKIEPFGRALCKDPKVKEESADAVAIFRKKVAKAEIRMPREFPDLDKTFKGRGLAPRESHLLAAACKIAQDGDYELKGFSDAAKSIAFSLNLFKAFLMFENARIEEIKNETFRLVADFEENPYKYEKEIVGIDADQVWEGLGEDGEHCHCVREDDFMSCLPASLDKRLYSGIAYALTRGVPSEAYHECDKAFWRQFIEREKHIITLYVLYDKITQPVGERLEWACEWLASDYAKRSRKNKT